MSYIPSHIQLGTVHLKSNYESLQSQHPLSVKESVIQLYAILSLSVNKCAVRKNKYINSFLFLILSWLLLNCIHTCKALITFAQAPNVLANV